MANENTRQCQLNRGGDSTAPGFMIRYLAHPEDGFVGTPKAVVGFNGTWDSVGGLVAPAGNAWPGVTPATRRG